MLTRIQVALFSLLIACCGSAIAVDVESLKAAQEASDNNELDTALALYEIALDDDSL